MANLKGHRLDTSTSVEYNEAYGVYEKIVPERKLLTAIIERAMLDAIKVISKANKHKIHKNIWTAEKTSAPVAYIMSKSKKQWSILWVLGQLFDNPKDIQKNIISKIEELVRTKKSLRPF